MHFFLQQVVNGLTTGSLYALIALGYSMVYGVLKLLNFAHGDLYMLGAFVGYFVLQWFGGADGLSIPVPLVLLFMFTAAAFSMGGLGMAIERFAYRPLRDAPRIAPLITALGVSFFLENTVLLLFGAQTRIYNTPDMISFKTGIHIGAFSIDIVRIGVIVLALLCMLVLREIVNRTTLGKSMRAVATDREAAEMLGIDVDRTIALTFFLGSALAGAGGLIFGLYYNFTSFIIGFTAGLRAFTAAVLGGIGNVPGAMVGGVLIGLIEAMGGQFIATAWTDVIIFSILVLVLVFVPTGLFGRATPNKS